jgi:hypothetical protein
MESEGLQRNSSLIPNKSGAQKSGPTLRSAPTILSSDEELSVLGSNQWHVHQMLAQEPHLQFIGPQNIADCEVIGSIVA